MPDIPSTSGLSFSAPSLRAVALSLDSAQFLIPGWFPALAHIHVSNFKTEGCSWLDYLPLLTQTPLLESLHFECSPETRPTQDPPQTGTLTLSRLQPITLRDVNLRWVLLFLERTELPADARVVATQCEVYGPTDIRTLPLLPLLATVDRAAMCIGPTKVQCVATGTAGALSICATFDREILPWAYGLPRAILDGVPRGNVVECSLNANMQWGPYDAQAEAEQLYNILRATPALRVLYLCADRDTLVETVGSAPLAALNALEELVLHVHPWGVGEVCAAVISMARERARRGRVLDRLGMCVVGDSGHSSVSIARAVSDFTAALAPAQEYAQSLTVRGYENWTSRTGRSGRARARGRCTSRARRRATRCSRCVRSVSTVCCALRSRVAMTSTRAFGHRARTRARCRLAVCTTAS